MERIDRRGRPCIARVLVARLISKSSTATHRAPLHIFDRLINRPLRNVDPRIFSSPERHNLHHGHRNIRVIRAGPIAPTPTVRELGTLRGDNQLDGSLQLRPNGGGLRLPINLRERQSGDPVIIHILSPIDSAKRPIREQRIEEKLHPFVDLLRIVALLRKIATGQKTDEHIASHRDRMLPLLPLGGPRAVARLLIRKITQSPMNHRLSGSIDHHRVRCRWRCIFRTRRKNCRHDHRQNNEENGWESHGWGLD